jgi:predicted Mrr-cat superfamily restriction endonuclease
VSFWFLPQPLSHEHLDEMVARGELAINAAGLPDLSRALSPDHIGQWLRHIAPDITPEAAAAQAEHLWELSHSLLLEDYIIAPVSNSDLLLIGEITGTYWYEKEDSKTWHKWQVRWLTPPVSQGSMTEIAPYLARRTLVELTDEKVKSQLRRHIPSLPSPPYALFKWMSIIILVFELIYFWPK